MLVLSHSAWVHARPLPLGNTEHKVGRGDRLERLTEMAEYNHEQLPPTTITQTGKNPLRDIRESPWTATPRPAMLQQSLGCRYLQMLTKRHHCYQPRFGNM